MVYLIYATIYYMVIVIVLTTVLILIYIFTVISLIINTITSHNLLVNFQDIIFIKYNFQLSITVICLILSNNS